MPYPIIAAVLLAVSISFLQTTTQAADSDSQMVNYLNQLRQQAGLIPWQQNDQLDAAAQNHANYLHRHHVRGHGEQRGKQGYTGGNHIDRLLYIGYSSRHASENASVHTYAADIEESVDGLMAAIYHRFAFLSMDYDEIGIGVSRTKDYTSFVYEMGNTRKRTLCEEPTPPLTSRYYTLTCKDSRKAIMATQFDQALFDTQASNPAIIFYPPADSATVLPAFYEEAPDPLPHHDVSGFPISIQFNPTHFPGNPPVITGWWLHNEEDGQQLETITRFDQLTDPHKKLTAYENVLFPLHRLNWGGAYRVSLNYDYEGQSHALEWSFRTRDLKLPIYEISARDQTIVAKPGQAFVIYTPPTSSKDANAEYQTQFMHQESVEIAFVDDHSLRITPRNVRGITQVVFHGRRIRIDVRP